MKFKPGHKKLPNAGRTKGTPNKKSLLIDSFAASVCDGGMERFMEQLEKLDGKDFINAYLTLFEYVKPKLSRIDATIEEKPTQADLSKLSKEELKLLLSLKQKMSA